MSSYQKVYCLFTKIHISIVNKKIVSFNRYRNIFKVREVAYLKLWIKGEEEGLSCAIKAIADFKGLRCQRTKHLETKQNENDQ